MVAIDVAMVVVGDGGNGELHEHTHTKYTILLTMDRKQHSAQTNPNHTKHSKAQRNMYKTTHQLQPTKTKDKRET